MPLALAGEAGERASGSRRLFARGRTSGAPLCAPHVGAQLPKQVTRLGLYPQRGGRWRPADLWDQPLIISHQRSDDRRLAQWMQRDLSELHIVATYNLVFNASLLVDEGLGYALALTSSSTPGAAACAFGPLPPGWNPPPTSSGKSTRSFPRRPQISSPA